MKKELAKFLPYNIDLIIPGFEKAYPSGVFKCASLLPIRSDVWYEEFKRTLESAIGTTYLPICRLSDGEFIFCIGKSILPARARTQSIKDYGIVVMKFYLARLLKGEFRKRYRGSSGLYTLEEWVEMRKIYAQMLGEIGTKGILALHLSYRDNQFHQQYFMSIMEWLRSNNIILTKRNYYPFYFVYALLSGPDRAAILGRERILLVTHCDSDKAARIEKSLKGEGAKDVQFLQISQDHSMRDKIDLSKVRLPIDVVLVGAGVGKPNILLQLEETNTLCIDAGFIIECMAYPELRRSRTFCWADSERNGDYTPI